MPTEKSNLVTTGQAAKIIGVSASYVRYLVSVGKIPITPIGSFNMIDREFAKSYERGTPGWPIGVTHAEMGERKPGWSNGRKRRKPDKK